MCECYFANTINDTPPSIVDVILGEKKYKIFLGIFAIQDLIFLLEKQENDGVKIESTIS